MGEFVATTLGRVPAGIVVPEPVLMLFDWVEASGFVDRGADGDLYGSLSADSPNGPGTNLLLRGSPPSEIGHHMAAWFGPVHDGLPTLWPFCRTGGDGSAAALWCAPNGQSLIVHLGSGSGSMLTCVLGETAVDFLRLLAIGYDEICWNDDWHEPPRPEPGRSSVNQPFRRWVETTFDTTIPARGLNLIPEPAEMGDADTRDPWCRWVNAAST